MALRHLKGGRSGSVVGSLRVLVLLAGAVVVIAAMLAMADHSRRTSDRARQAEVVMERLRAESLRLDAITWRMLATADGRTPAGVARAVTRGRDSYRAITADLRRLDRLDVAPARMARVRTAMSTFSELGLSGEALTGSAASRARRLAADKFSPAVARLTASISVAAREQGRQAAAAQRRTQTAWLGSLVIGLLLLILLGWRLHIIQRSAAVALRAREAERHTEQRLRALVRHSSDVVMVVDAAGAINWLAESVEGMLGHQPHVLLGGNVTDLVHPDEAHRAVRMLEEAVQQRGRDATVSLQLRHADGTYRHVEVIADSRVDDPDVSGILLNLRDISDRLALEDELRHQAFHDRLTGLPNRALFDDRVTQALARVRRRGDGAAVFFIDLDDFMAINDSRGHGAGDELLCAIGERLVTTLRAQDTVARIGGDEFAVLVEELADDKEAVTLAERLLTALMEPLTVGGRRVTPSASIGVAWPTRTATGEGLLGNAGVAMYEAKQRGKGRVVAFELAMRARLTERLSLTSDLETALENKELFLDYQPVVALDTNTITSVEALIRWQHPRRGRVGPDQFIPVAESTGLIVPIGEWVLQVACHQLQRWEEAGSPAANLGMNVNVSIRQLSQPGFPAAVRQILENSGIAPSRLTLEITEYMLLDDSDLMQRQLSELKAIGVQLAVDDFGTGYSSLSYLQSFPIDALKIDRSFVAGIDKDSEKARLVRGIIDIGNTLGLRVVTEGIETPGEAALLRAIRSGGYGQGYLFSRPVSPVALLALLSSGLPLAEGEPVKTTV